METSVRRASVAGYFYPSDARELESEVKAFLRQAKPKTGLPTPKALIVPHAGYQYSGAVAGAGYALLEQGRDTIKRVILIGPSHFEDFHGLALPSAARFETPLGPVPVNRSAVKKISAVDQVQTMDAPHRKEHSLEVQLPFLQVVLADFEAVPLAVGRAEKEEIAEVLDALWGGAETLVIVSSDLSHYYDDRTARKLDQAVAHAIEALTPDDVHREQACGYYPVKGFLEAARRHRLKAETIRLGNSGETGGPLDRVVGYGAFAFTEPA